MRVIAGEARGRRLRELPGLATRPTTDKVKESMFNIIQFDIEGRRVLDLFAGTGQLGIEALSRGADRATFVDMAPAAVEVVRQNLETVGFTSRAQVVQKDFRAFLTGCRETYDLIFLDPPYRETALENALETIAGIDILNEHGIIVCESPLEKELPELTAPYERGRTYKYGKIQVTLYRKST
jgi:16S rRNA (guanine(966)-N(2))-methyltransferase RsmD